MASNEVTPEWVEGLCLAPITFRGGSASILDLFTAAAPPLDDAGAFLAPVRSFLLARPELVEAWHGYSMDKRSTPNPYLEILADSALVGFYGEEGKQDVKHYRDPVDACADFIYREANSVLLGRRVSP